MKKFSKNWKASKRPKKQRKYAANAPIHIKRKMLSVNLSKELREKHKMRNFEVRKGDTVKIMVGKHKGKKAKDSEINTKKTKIYIEGIQNKKQDGSMVNIPFRASNIQILELVTDDKKRFKKLKMETSKKKEKPEIKTEKTEIKKDLVKKEKENKKWKDI